MVWRSVRRKGKVGLYRLFCPLIVYVMLLTLNCTPLVTSMEVGSYSTLVKKSFFFYISRFHQYLEYSFVKILIIHVLWKVQFIYIAIFRSRQQFSQWKHAVSTLPSDYYVIWRRVLRTNNFRYSTSTLPFELYVCWQQLNLFLSYGRFQSEPG